MLNATRDLTLPTTVTGSWPRPSWFTEVLEAYQPAIAGEKLRGGPLQYAALFKVAQRVSARPVKFGSISAQTMTKMIINRHYASDRELILDASDIVNAELREVAAAGCR